MLVRKIYQTKKFGIPEKAIDGWFLFGFIPVYVKIVYFASNR